MAIRRLLITALTALTTLLLVAVPLQGQNVTPEALFSRGRAALLSGNLEAAESAFRQVVRLDPNQTGAWVNLGVIAMRRQQWPLAVVRLRKAERLDPGLGGIRLNLGLAYFHWHRYADAIPSFRSVLRDQPGSLQARYLLGMCLFLTRDDRGAVTELEPLWDRENGDFTYLYVLGIAASHSHRPRLSQRAELRLLEVGKGSPEFELIMGRTFLNRDEAQPALAALKAADQGNPRLPMLHFNLGLAYQKMHRYQRARQEFLADIALEPDVAYNYDHLGQLEALQHHNASAAGWYRKALRRDPRLATARYGLAEVLIRQRQYAAALHQLEATARLSPSSGSVYYLKGRALMGLGHHRQAQQAFATATRLQKASQDKLEMRISGRSLPRSLPGAPQ